MVRSSFPMNRLVQGGSHPSFHGDTQDLMYMRVHEFEVAMLESEIEYYAHYMDWWAVCR